MAAPFDKSGIIEFFLIEAGEHLRSLNQGLLSLEKDPADGGIIDELFRAAHTLKGSAAMMGFQGISEVAHKAEDMLGQYRSGTVRISNDTLNFLFDSVDAMKLMVDGVAGNKPEDTLVVDSIKQSYNDVIEKVRGGAAPPPSQDAPVTTEEEEEFTPAAGPAADIPPMSAGTDEGTQSAETAVSEPTMADELDLAWERTFITEMGNEPASYKAEENAAESHVSEEPGAAAPRDTVELPAQPAPAEAHALSTLGREIEEAKRSGIHEKRGMGRRSADTADIEKQFIRVNIERLDNLMNLVGEMVVNRNRLARQVEFIKSLREELAFSQTRLLHEIKKFEEKYEYTLTFGMAGPQPAAAIEEQPGDFMELEFDRYDDFNLLSRKLMEITNDTNEIMTELAGFFDSFELDTARISTITTNLQDEITMARMVEMDRLYQMFQRPVRDLSRQENKQVSLVVSGGETKIDKTVFEVISDPLMHMIRNSISHGIESPDERRAAGKDPVGSLIMNARHEGNSIILEIEDDGQGIDPEELRKIAADRGFLTASEAQSLTDLEALNLIFRAGFSTAKSVGKVSGRGVGMDVVATHLAKINGRIEIRTEKGVGTKFLIRLPLTLTIAQALIVKFQDQEIAVPMNLVEETTRFSFKEIQRAAGEEMVNIRGTLIRLLKLNDLLKAPKFPKKDDGFRHPALILGMAERRIALLVENIIGREEIVVKSLGEYLQGVRMFSGATISGEGNVRLILNVSALFGEEKSAQSTRASFISSKETAPRETERRKPKVLIVDDSISIRKYVQRFLDRTGFEVEAAPDGMEALNVMAKTRFDVVITDLEMPVMHGYDLIAEMKRSSGLMNIPVIVLTSRAGEKHRQKAIDMGAQDYLVKPFEEQEMLAALKKLLDRAAFAHRG